MNLPSRLGATVITLVLVVMPVSAQSNAHPNLIMTKAGVEAIRAELGSVPLFDQTVQAVKAEVDAEIARGIDTPIPKDFSGGYTHQRHKRNFFMLQKAGVLFQILEDEKYAIYIRDMLFRYEQMYKNLPLHPQTRSYARGKLFWQCLNDANWLVYVSQAYDSIYEWLSIDERQTLEKNLFRPFADHLSVDSPQFFNRVHNHSTWGNAAVGMIGLVMGDDELVQRALYGIADDGLPAGIKDDDGGFIREKGQRAGFLANLEEPFSPSGYYTEGPYYQRYAMYPFLIFAQSLQNAKPELEVLQHKNGVLLKAVDALLNLADADGEFFALNDAQKGMSFQARELVTAVNLAYHLGEQNPGLLAVAEQQGQVLLDDAGFSVAQAIRDGKTQPFVRRSVNLSDGPNGNQGGVAVLRDRGERLTLVFKYTSQGLSHGHYDKLSFSLFEDGTEVLQDYGMVRFVNVEQKGGGNYLKENNAWAKQTIAHNTITQNETSHFEGRYEIGSQHHSDLHFYDDAGENVQVISAVDANAYPGTVMRRTMALIEDEQFGKPFVLDIFKVDSKQANRYDLPFYFMGQVIDTNFQYQVPASLSALGKDNGYQYLHTEGKGSPNAAESRFTWLNTGRFYTLTSVAADADELLFTRIGANDPEFNLRRDAAFMLRRNDVSDTIFVSTIESHGTYSPVSESAIDAHSNIASLAVTYDDENYTAVRVESVAGRKGLFVLSNSDVGSAVSHELKIDGKYHRWVGPYQYFD